MAERPGAFALATQSDGQLHLISDLPKRVSVSKVLWDALAAGAHPSARIEPAGRAIGSGSLDYDLVVETVECTFRYRKTDYDSVHDHYVLELVSWTTPREPDPPILDMRDRRTSDYTDPAWYSAKYNR
jgi:hypothetical protein